MFDQPFTPNLYSSKCIATHTGSAFQTIFTGFLLDKDQITIVSGFKYKTVRDLKLVFTAHTLETLMLRLYYLNSLIRYTKSTLECFRKHYNSLLAFKFNSFLHSTTFTIDHCKILKQLEKGFPFFNLKNFFKFTYINNFFLRDFKNPLRQYN